MPGRTKWCSVATRAVSVRRGSNTTTRPPRALMASSRRLIPGADMMLPLDTSGLAPSITKRSQRSTSGTDINSWCPYIRYDASIFGSWSTDVAE